jgi:hypothetical protein
MQTKVVKPRTALEQAEQELARMNKSLVSNAPLRNGDRQVLLPLSSPSVIPQSPAVDPLHVLDTELSTGGTGDHADSVPVTIPLVNNSIQFNVDTYKASIDHLTQPVNATHPDEPVLEPMVTITDHLEAYLATRVLYSAEVASGTLDWLEQAGQEFVNLEFFKLHLQIIYRGYAKSHHSDQSYVYARSRLDKWLHERNVCVMTDADVQNRIGGLVTALYNDIRSLSARQQAAVRVMQHLHTNELILIKNYTTLFQREFVRTCVDLDAELASLNDVLTTFLHATVMATTTVSDACMVDIRERLLSMVPDVGKAVQLIKTDSGISFLSKYMEHTVPMSTTCTAVHDFFAGVHTTIESHRRSINTAHRKAQTRFDTIVGDARSKDRIHHCKLHHMYKRLSRIIPNGLQLRIHELYSLNIALRYMQQDRSFIHELLQMQLSSMLPPV